MVWLTVLTILLILLLVAVLVIGLVRIIQALEAIGGPDRGYMGRAMSHVLSRLAKARWGVRAIEVQTSAIQPQVTRLNESLAALDVTLATLEEGLGGVVSAVRRQGGGA